MPASVLPVLNAILESAACVTLPVLHALSEASSMSSHKAGTSSYPDL